MRLLKVPTVMGEWHEDTTNRFMAAMTGDGGAVVLSGGGVLVGSPQEAINLAAWLIVMAEGQMKGDFSEDRFIELLDKIRAV